MANGARDGKKGLDLERELTRAAVTAGLFGARAGVRLGRFELKNRLGQGGMGTVYEAIDTERGGSVALKVLSSVNPRAVYQLKREFRSLSDLLHPNLVRLHELFCEQEQWFFTMERLEGEPFDRWVRNQNGCTTPDELYALLRQLASAVEAIHAANKLHCDLKPSNVLVTTEGRVVVLDFGLVGEQGLMVAAHSGSGLAGTPAYLAPEQAAGERPSPASDWYAVGVMLFQTLSGRLPFDGPPLRVLTEKQHSDAPELTTLEHALMLEVPAALRSLCDELLRRDPARRAGSDQVRRVLGETPHELASARRGRSRPGGAWVGREAELQALNAALEAARNGRPSVVLLAGRSGMGKSALLERFVAECSPHALVLSGRCHEQEAVPYKVFDGILDAISRYLRKLPESEVQALLPRHLRALLQLFPVLAQVTSATFLNALRPAPTGPRETRNQAFAAFKELLLRLSDRMLLVVAIDDLQWGDIDSARMLRHLLSPPECPPLLLVGTYRDDEVHSSAFLRQALSDWAKSNVSSPQTLEIGPLARASAAQLARELLGSEPDRSDAMAETIAAESDGVPFLISELARSFAQGPTHASGALMSPRPALEQVVLERVAALVPAARRLLQLVSVAAGPLERSAAIEAADLPRGDWLTLHDLRNARLIRTRRETSDDSVETYHDRIREIVVRGMSQQEIKDAHARIAQALQGLAETDPERLVSHLIGAGERVRAGTTAVQAAHAAAHKLAFNRAATLFRQAIDLLSSDDRRSPELHRELGDCLVNAGRGDEAVTAYLTAAAQLAPDVSRRVLRLAAKYALRNGDTRQGVTLARSLLHDVGIELPAGAASTVGKLVWQRARLRLRGLRASRLRAPDAARRERLDTLGELAPEFAVADTLTGALLLTRYLHESLDAGDPDHMFYGLLWEAYSRAYVGGKSNEQHAVRSIERARALATHADSPHARGMLLLAEATRLSCGGRRFEDASTAAGRAREIFSTECKGAFWEHAVVTYIQSSCLDVMGDMKGHSELIQRYQRDAEEREDTFLSVVLTVGRSLDFLVKDDVESALGHLERQRHWVSESNTTWPAWWLRMADALTYAGRSQEALDLIEADWGRFCRTVHNGSRFVRQGARYSRARSAVAAYFENGRAPGMRAHAWKTALAIEDESTVFGGYRAALIGALQAADGDRDAAVRSLQLSMARFRSAQTGVACLYPERVLCELTRDTVRLARIDADLRAQGVTNPARYVWTGTPSRHR